LTHSSSKAIFVKIGLDFSDFYGKYIDMTVNGVQNIIVEMLGQQDVISMSEIKLALRGQLKDEKLREQYNKK